MLFGEGILDHVERTIYSLVGDIYHGEQLIKRGQLIIFKGLNNEVLYWRKNNPRLFKNSYINQELYTRKLSFATTDMIEDMFDRFETRFNGISVYKRPVINLDYKKKNEVV